MKTYTAINNETGAQFTFNAPEGNNAAEEAEKKFKTLNITIRDEETGEEFPIIAKWLSDTAYIRRCHVSGRYLIFVKDNMGTRKASFVPVCEMTKDIVPEDIINEFNEVEKRKSTHTIEGWYIGFGFWEDGVTYAWKNYLEKKGNITFSVL